jgi:putative ABC transport system permease protein
MPSFLLDVRAALRFFARRKVSAAVALATIALALGASTAVFTVLNAFLFSSLGVPDAERVHQIASTRELPGRGSVEFYNGWPACELLARESRGFAAVGAVQFGDFVWDRGGDGEPRRLLGARVTAQTFSVWQTRPALGRVFRADEEGPSAARVVMISHRLWQAAFSGRTEALGQTLRLGGVPHEIVGVMPAGFSLPPDTDVWLPQEVSPELRARGFGAKLFAVYARLAEGVTAAVAQEELLRLSRRAIELDASNRDWTFRSRPLRAVLLEGSERTVLLLQGGALVLLLLAAANVASLQLAWAAERQTETAVRLALGAPARRLIRQYLTQSLVLIGAGGTLGVLLAWWSLPLWQQLNPSPDLAALLAEARLDVNTLGFSAGLVFGTALLAGVLPAWQTRGTNLVDALKSGAKGTTSAGNLRAQHAMVFLQTAIAVLVLGCAAQAGVSFRQLRRLSLGFAEEQRGVFRVQLPAATHATGADRARFALRLGEELQRPDVFGAGLATTLPVDDVRQRTGFAMEDATGTFTEEAVPLHLRGVSPGYLAVMGIPLRAGRGIEARDLAPDAPRVALVSEVIASKYWPDGTALGRRVRRIVGGVTEYFEIVGVVANVQDAGAAGPAGETIYLPLQFSPARRVSVVVHSASAARAIAAGRAALRATDPNLASFAIAPLADLAARASALPRLQTLLLTLFASVALGVTLLGAYGVTAQAVASRRREFAVRLALGARPGQLLRATLVRHARLGTLAAGAGAFAAALVGRTLYGGAGLGWAGPAVALAVLLALQLVSAVPTWRGTRVDVARQLAGD